MVKYIVQRGDTLATIAMKYRTSVKAIVRVNGIRNPDMIYKGQILRIPTKHYYDNNYNNNYNNYSDNNSYKHHYYNNNNDND